MSRRFVSMADAHHAGIEWTLVAENWSGRAEVISAVDGRVSNIGVARYQQLEGRHLNPVSPRTFGPEVIALKVETRQSNLYISEAARTRVFSGGQPLPAERTLYQMEDYIQQVLAFHVRQGVAVRVEKMVTFYTSRDPAVSDTLVKAATSAARHTDFAASFERHTAAWEELWRRVTCTCPETSACNNCCGCTSRTSSRSVPITPLTSTRGCPPAGSRSRASGRRSLTSIPNASATRSMA